MPALRDDWGDEARRLLQLLAQRERVDPGWRPAAVADWLTFAEICEIHQVVPYVYCRLRGLTKTVGLAGLLEHLRTRFLHICARNYQLAKKLVDLTSMLQNEGVPVLAYKGPALVMAVYGSLALRQYNDLDLVIRKEHQVKVVRLMKGWSYQIAPTLAVPRVRPFLGHPEDPRNFERTQEIEFCAPDSTYFVDLHWQLGDLFWRPLHPDVEKFWDRAERQDLPQGSVSTLCREDLFLALCAHGNRHRWIRLKWLVDIAELLRNAQPLDWSRVEEMVSIRPGAAASANVALLLAHDLLEAPVPDAARRILPTTSRTLALAAAIREELLQSGQTSGDEHSTLLALEARRLARMKYHAVRIISYPGGLFREIFLQVSPMDRALIRLPNRLQFLYHLIRPIRLAVKHCVRVARTLWLTAI
jgi:putative nucleotidyltransferase-like protein